MCQSESIGKAIGPLQKRELHISWHIHSLEVLADAHMGGEERAVTLRFIWGKTRIADSQT